MAALRDKLTKWRRLRPSERAAFRIAYVLLPVTTASLKISGLAVTRKRLTRWLPTRPLVTGSGPEDQAEAIARMVAAAARLHPVPAKCLAKSMTLWFLLARVGIDSQVRIGVAVVDDLFDAHAWVDLEGRILLGTPESVSQYSVMI